MHVQRHEYPALEHALMYLLCAFEHMPEAPAFEDAFQFGA
jgi:hypothetical protein